MDSALGKKKKTLLCVIIIENTEKLLNAQPKGYSFGKGDSLITCIVMQLFLNDNFETYASKEKIYDPLK